MRVNGPLEFAARGGYKTLVANARPVEKPSASSYLGSQTPDFAQTERKRPPHLVVELVSQAETDGHDPFWDGPRLLPSFVTQLLGQVMPDRRETVSVETAYGTAVPRKALLVDRKS